MIAWFRYICLIVSLIITMPELLSAQRLVSQRQEDVEAGLLYNESVYILSNYSCLSSNSPEKLSLDELLRKQIEGFYFYLKRDTETNVLLLRKPDGTFTPFSESLEAIKTALREASQFYVQLHSMGFNVEFVDIGGGLGVDYDGTRSSNSEGSVNYSIQEYVNDSISTLVDVSDKNGIPHPNIITESGRALTAHHSVLIFEVLETATLPEWDDEEEIAPDAHELVQELYSIWDSLNQNKMLEAWHDAQQIREEALDLFSHGIVDLKTRAQIERLYWSITREINQIAGGLKHAPDEFRGLSKLLADKYFCNFSLFQSLPDSWAIDQIFPIMPIQRLDEKPERSATLQDITCDSDGKIANFISTRNVAHYLPVHSLKKTEPYYLAVFLVGAYQEILGDMHNLFGDTNAVHVSVNEKGYNIEQIIDGETVAEVLDYVQYNPKKLVRTLETWVTKSVKEGKISLEEGKEFLSNYRSGLYGYTYLE